MRAFRIGPRAYREQHHALVTPDDGAVGRVGAREVHIPGVHVMSAQLAFAFDDNLKLVHFVEMLA